MSVVGACNTATDFMVLTIFTEATADAGSDTAVCYNTSPYQITGAVATNENSILWTSSGGGTFVDATIENPVYNFVAVDITAGTVTLTMTVVGDCNTATDFMVLTIDPEAFADAGADDDICYHASPYQISGAVATNENSILWTTSGGGTFDDATLENPAYNFVAADITAGTVTLTMTVVGDCNTATDFMVLTIDPEPKASAINDGPVCWDATSLTLGENGADAISWVWTSNGSATITNITDQNPTATGFVNGEIFTVTITDANGCTSTSSTTVTVYPEPTAIASNNGPGCLGQDITLYETGGDAILWQWVSDGSATFNYDTVQNPVASGAVNGEIFTVTITDANGCNSSDTTLVMMEHCFSCDYWIIEGDTICFETDPTWAVAEAGVITGTGPCPGDNAGVWTNPVYPGSTPAFIVDPNLDVTSFSVQTPGQYVLRYTWAAADTSVEATYYFAEAPNTEIVGNVDVVTCTEETYIALDNRTYTFEDLSYQWYVTGGTIVGSSTDDVVTIYWDNMPGQDTLIIHTWDTDFVQCEDWDTIIITKVAPSLAGQVKYWNEYETYMPTPFPTNIYGTFPEDYFYVTLYHIDGPQVDSIATAVVQPRLMEDLTELMSYFEFDINTWEFNCGTGYLLKVWDGGLSYHTGPMPPPVSGTYLGESFTYTNWGGVNATDALAIQTMVGGAVNINGAPWNYSWVGLNNDYPYYGYYSHAIADVNSSNTYNNGGITALDALTVKYRTIGLLGSYPYNGPGTNQFTPNYRVTGRMVDSLPQITFPDPFDYDSVNDLRFTHSGNDYLYFSEAIDHKYMSYPGPLNSDKNYINIYYEAIGDVNASYVPTLGGFKDIAYTDLIYEGLVGVSKDEEAIIPVRIDRDAEIGAVTMSFNYRNDLIEVLGTNYADDHVFINHEKGILNIAWYSTEAIELDADAIIAQIRVRVLSDIESDTHLFRLNAITELADQNAHRIDNINLKTVGITTDRFAISGNELLATNYPNPFNDKTTFKYSLPETGEVRLVVYNLMGGIVATLVDEIQEAGAQTVEFNRLNIQDGVYIYRITLEGEDKLYTATGSMNITLNPYNTR